MAFCSKCGTPAAENQAFCQKCGTRIEAVAPQGNSFFSSGANLDLEPPKPHAPTPRFDAPPPPPPAPELPPQELFVKPQTPQPTRKRISPAKELKLLLRQGVLILTGDKRNLIISLLFPFIAALITVWIAGENMFETYEATKSACFILVCAAIWGGLFNSIQSLVKERDNIKRDYVSGALRIECYMGSRAIIQLVLCLFQSLVLSMSIPMIGWVHGNSMPSSGLFTDLVFMEFYISIFFIMMASDALGLLISSIVKKDELAGKIAPYILILQLLFSGVLFKLEGAGNILSGIMISRWGMEALGSICDLNNIPTTIYTEMTDEGFQPGMCPCNLIEELEHMEFQQCFDATAGHFALVLFIMLLFIAVPLVLADLMLHRVKKDGRD